MQPVRRLSPVQRIPVPADTLAPPAQAPAPPPPVVAAKQPMPMEKNEAWSWHVALLITFFAPRFVSVAAGVLQHELIVGLVSVFLRSISYPARMLATSAPAILGLVLYMAAVGGSVLAVGIFISPFRSGYWGWLVLLVIGFVVAGTFFHVQTLGENNGIYRWLNYDFNEFDSRLKKMFKSTLHYFIAISSTVFLFSFIGFVCLYFNNRGVLKFTEANLAAYDQVRRQCCDDAIAKLTPMGFTAQNVRWDRATCDDFLDKMNSTCISKLRDLETSYAKAKFDFEQTGFNPVQCTWSWADYVLGFIGKTGTYVVEQQLHFNTTVYDNALLIYALSSVVYAIPPIAPTSPATPFLVLTASVAISFASFSTGWGLFKTSLLGSIFNKAETGQIPPEVVAAMKKVTDHFNVNKP